MARSLARLCASHAAANRNGPGKSMSRNCSTIPLVGLSGNRVGRPGSESIADRAATARAGASRRWRRSDLFTKSVQSVTRSSRLGVDKLNRLCTRAAYRGEAISKPGLPDGANRSKKSQENTLCRNSRGRSPSHLMFAVAERCIVHWSRAPLRPCSSASGSRRTPLRAGASSVPTAGTAITAIRHRSPVEGCAPRRRGGKGPSRKKKWASAKCRRARCRSSSRSITRG